MKEAATVRSRKKEKSQGSSRQPIILIIEAKRPHSLVAFREMNQSRDTMRKAMNMNSGQKTGEVGANSVWKE